MNEYNEYVTIYLAIDDSIPNLPVYNLVLGENMAQEYFDSGWKVQEVEELSFIMRKLMENGSFTLLDVTSTHQWWKPNQEFE